MRTKLAIAIASVSLLVSAAPVWAHHAFAAEFDVADALQLPFGDGSFDLVWTQHASMNIADKTQLYREMKRWGLEGTK